MPSISAPYDPNNWTESFEGPLTPEDFVLAEMDFMPSFPNGLVEITPENYEVHGTSLPIEYRRYQVRTFVMKSTDNRAALVRLNGDHLDKEMIEDYLKRHARYVDGFIIRELGLLAAALYEVVCAFSNDPNVQAVLQSLCLLHDEYDLPPKRTVGALNPVHPFLKLVATIELQTGVPSWVELMHTDTPMRAFQKRWNEAMSMFPQWINSGSLPFGLATYSDYEGDGNYQLRPIPLRGRAAHAVGRSRSMSHCDIYLMSDPRGVVCMLAVNGLDGMGALDMENSNFFNAVVNRYPAMSAYVRANIHSEWALFDGMLLEIGSDLVNEKRSRGADVAWHLPELPSVTHPDRDVSSPFVLNCAIFEQKAFGQDLLQLIREG